MKNSNLRDMTLISMLAALSIVTKPFVRTFSFSITSMYGLPGGIIGGIFYMMWLSLIFRVTNKKYSVILFAILQGVLAMTMNGIGLYKALLFIPSGIVAQIILSNVKNSELVGNVLAGAFANLVGSIAMYFLLFSNQKSPLLYGLIISFFSGGASGFVTQFICNRLKSFGLIKANVISSSGTNYNT